MISKSVSDDPGGRANSPESGPQGSLGKEAEGSRGPEGSQEKWSDEESVLSWFLSGKLKASVFRLLPRWSGSSSSKTHKKFLKWRNYWQPILCLCRQNEKGGFCAGFPNGLIAKAARLAFHPPWSDGHAHKAKKWPLGQLLQQWWPTCHYFFSSP